MESLLQFFTANPVGNYKFQNLNNFYNFIILIIDNNPTKKNYVFITRAIKQQLGMQFYNGFKIYCRTKGLLFDIDMDTNDD